MYVLVDQYIASPRPKSGRRCAYRVVPIPDITNNLDPIFQPKKFSGGEKITGLGYSLVGGCGLELCTINHGMVMYYVAVLIE